MQTKYTRKGKVKYVLTQDEAKAIHKLLLYTLYMDWVKYMGESNARILLDVYVELGGYGD
jgi:hypothetical protein